jgi:hypothetical protein
MLTGCVVVYEGQTKTMEEFVEKLNKDNKDQIEYYFLEKNGEISVKKRRI